MGIARGPHLIKDNLVFGYDTGYGVADSNTSTRFYPGQPTTNLVPLSLSNSSWFAEYSGGRTLRSETLFGQPAYEFKSNDGQIWVSPFAFNSYDRSTNDLTLSVYAKNIGSSTVSMNTYFGGDYSTDSFGSNNTKSLPPDNTWRRYSWTRFSSAMGTNYLEFRTANSGVVISCPQLEVGRFVSPIVDGTRSSTQSLIDLKRTRDINVSTVSFDLTGQPDFDGSDEYIQLGNDDWIRLGSNFTIEAVVKPEEDKWMYHFWKGYGSNNSLALGRHSSNDKWMFASMVGGSYVYLYTGTATVNKYCHLVYTYDGSNVRIYENGILQTTSAQTHDMLTSNSSAGIGGPNRYWNGKIPVTKVYNSVLSADEIKQNFNAYKNRFNI